MKLSSVMPPPSSAPARSAATSPAALTTWSYKWPLTVAVVAAGFAIYAAHEGLEEDGVPVAPVYFAFGLLFAVLALITRLMQGATALYTVALYSLALAPFFAWTAWFLDSEWGDDDLIQLCWLSAFLALAVAVLAAIAPSVRPGQPRTLKPSRARDMLYRLFNVEPPRPPVDSAPYVPNGIHAKFPTAIQQEFSRSHAERQRSPSAWTGVPFAAREQRPRGPRPFGRVGGH